MELLLPNNQLIRHPGVEKKSSDKSFIQANTIESSLEEIRHQHIIPVFIKDNEPVISHAEFIDAVWDVASGIYAQEQLLQPAVRLSHPIKGRIPEAKEKPANALLEHEKTIYYERMAFVIEIPTVYDEVDGSLLSLCIGGVKAYNLDNLYNKKGADEHFKLFIGFKNTICTNLCVWSDGYMGDLKVKSVGQLRACIRTMIENYNLNFHMFEMRQLVNYSLTEKQFATVIGRCRMYNYLPHHAKNEITPLSLNDTQVGTICRDYYRDESFCRDESGNINLWRLYNLFTGANKSTYIDNFLDRGVNAYHFVEHLKLGLKNNSGSWFMQ